MARWTISNGADKEFVLRPMDGSRAAREDALANGSFATKADALRAVIEAAKQDRLALTARSRRAKGMLRRLEMDHD